MELAERFVDLLKELGAELLPGLSDEELDAAEAKHGIRFPKVIREVYRRTGGSVTEFAPCMWRLWSPLRDSLTVRDHFGAGDSLLPVSSGQSPEPQTIHPAHYAGFMDRLFDLPVYAYRAHPDLPAHVEVIECFLSGVDGEIHVSAAAASPEVFIESFIIAGGKSFHLISGELMIL